ncbi:MAG: ParB/RepB/Spo0J family partition protein [bacterium]|nr:ParB/RepB/Spo0J family partition protein [bacterium]
MSSQFFNNSIFWIETDKIKPNPFQPRREFDEARLNDLAESIKMYGILQPLVVTRKEFQTPEGGMAVEYELISGERRLRASKIAGLFQVPVLIRASEDSDREKLELAIIENLQREDLNVVERARAFEKLVEDFGLKHHEIAMKIGRSREYVTNSLRVLLLPGEMLNALSEGKINEGHTRPILMLVDRPEEQQTLFKEIILKKMNVRDAEQIARSIAVERARRIPRSPEQAELENMFSEILGTRVMIEAKPFGGGKIRIDFFSNDDLMSILDKIKADREILSASQLPDQIPDRQEFSGSDVPDTSALPVEVAEDTFSLSDDPASRDFPIDDRSPNQKREDDDTDLYSLKNFTV